MAILGDHGRLKLKRDTTPEHTYVCDIVEWELRLEANSIDITPLGTTYGEAIKDLVTGGGSINFNFEWREVSEDPKALVDLVTLTKTGAQAGLQLYLLYDRDQVGCTDQVPGSLYWNMNVLITRCNISVRTTEFIRGAAEFVTTEEFRLVEVT